MDFHYLIEIFYLILSFYLLNIILFLVKIMKDHCIQFFFFNKIVYIAGLIPV